MSDSEKKQKPKKAVARKRTPKTEAPKAAPKAAPKTLADLKKEFVAAKKANPEKAAELKEQFLKEKAAIKKAL